MFQVTTKNSAVLFTINRALGLCSKFITCRRYSHGSQFYCYRSVYRNMPASCLLVNVLTANAFRTTMKQIFVGLTMHLHRCDISAEFVIVIFVVVTMTIAERVGNSVTTLNSSKRATEVNNGHYTSSSSAAVVSCRSLRTPRHPRLLSDRSSNDRRVQTIDPFQYWAVHPSVRPFLSIDIRLRGPRDCWQISRDA